MAIWLAGLATAASAKRAARWGSTACFLQAARITIGNIFRVATADKPVDAAIVWFVGASLIPVLFIAAGIKLRKGEGWILGSLAALTLVLDFAVWGRPASNSGLFYTSYAYSSLIVKTILLLFILNGVRGILALQRNDRV